MDPPRNLPDDELLRLVREAVALPNAPAAWIERAAAIGGAPAAAPARAAAVLRRVVAVLQFDSFARPALALGLRAPASPTRRLLFDAGPREIDLHLLADAGGLALSGQLIGPDGAGRVDVVDHPADGAAAVVRTAGLDAHGGFAFDLLPPGVLSVALQLGDERLELPPIDAAD